MSDVINEEHKLSLEEISILEKSYKIDSPCVSCNLNDISKVSLNLKMKRCWKFENFVS